MELYQVIIVIVVSLIVLFFIFGYVVNDIVLNKIYGRRGDGSISIKYSYPSHYPNLKVKKSYFLNNKKARLSIYEYIDKSINDPKAVILLAHGIGGGHFYLLPLINHLCKNGYLVVAYDQYASGTSEGLKLEAMTQGNIDVKYAVRYVNDNYPKMRFFVMGHSWGGYCAAQALKYSKRIEKCVDIAGLDSEAMMVRQMSKYGGFAYHLVRFCCFTHYGFHAYQTTYGIFKKTHAKVLYLQGKEDASVLPKYSGYLYQKKLKNHKNIEIKMLDKKGHAPFVDYDSQLKQAEVMKQFGILGGVLVDQKIYVDYVKTSIPDMEIYNLIVNYLDN